MNVQGYSVYDRAVKAFMPVFFARTDGEAIRSFGDLFSDPKHSFSQHPEDYVLYRVGAFDDSTGTLTSDVVELVKGNQYISQ